MWKKYGKSWKPPEKILDVQAGISTQYTSTSAGRTSVNRSFVPN
jgi:hypothetical protein